jgi:hypothetical protein
MSLNQLHRKDSVQDDGVDPAPANCELLPVGESLQIYNEHAFQYFLAHEQKRSQRARARFLLLLVASDDGNELGAAAPGLFTALAGVLRDTDFVGWYRDRRTIGAVLTQRGDLSAAAIEDVIERVGQRVRDIIRPDVAGVVRIDVSVQPNGDGERG